MNLYAASIQKYNIPKSLLGIDEVLLKSQNLILCNYQIEEEKTMLDFLQKIEQAVFGKSDLTAKRIFLQKNQFFKVSDWIKGSQARSLISFGLPPSQLCLQGFSQQHVRYQWCGCQFIFAENLEEYFHLPQKKAMLWSALQTLELSS
ncbi:MAG: hypothetical protein IPM48_11130 [Saprospiraceae bacterium]|nr:hypothetical protein [Saprospiraceae bacterium]